MSKVITPLNTPNNTQNFYPADDMWELREVPFEASVAIIEGAAVSPEIVTNNVTGNLTLMGTENATGSDFFGIMAEAVTADDADYATAGKFKSVWVPKSTYAKAFFKVGAGTFTAADVFKTVEIHSDSASLAVDTLGKGARILEYKSATQGVCRFSLPETEVA